MTTREPSTWIKQPAAVFTANELDAGGGVVVRDDRIVELVGMGKEPKTPADNTFDASGKVLLPGLVNGHHHFYQTLTRAFPPALNKPLFGWLKTLYPVWANLTEEAVAVSTRLALAELMLSGCTTASDHHYLFSAALTRAIDIQAETAQALGMRVVLTRGSMSLSVEDGGLPPRTVTEPESAILAESERLIRRYHDAAPHAMCQIALAPCSPFSVTSDLMRDTARLARVHGVRLHTHLGETMDENEYCVEKFGMRPLDYLEDVDWLADDVWLAPRHPFHEGGDRAPRSRRHRRMPLPLLQHGAGVGHLPRARPACGRCARGPGRRRLRVQRFLQPDAGSPPSTAHRPAPVRRGARHPPVRPAARHPRERGSARARPSSASCTPAPPPTSRCSTWTNSGSADMEIRSPRWSCAARHGYPS